MTPLIDVSFQLIIFFMLVNQIVTVENPAMNLPRLVEPVAEQVQPEGSLWVNVLRLGDGKPEVWIGTRRIAPDDWASVTDRVADEQRGRSVLVRADGGLAYEDVAPVLQAVREAGVQRVGLVVLGEEDGRE